MYADKADGEWSSAKFDFEDFTSCNGYCQGFFMGFAPCCCCYTPSLLISNCCHQRKQKGYRHPSVRIGLSMMEWMIIIIWALVDDDKYKLLFSFEHGLFIFILSMICYFIHTQYLYFFPDLSLPHGIPIRSIYGYAFCGELEEL